MQSGSDDAAPVILFDGACRLCNRSVVFIARHDTRRRYRFAHLQSETGKEIASRYLHGCDPLETVLLIENQQVFVRSTAALRILKGLGGIWSLVYVFVVIPPPLRDALYTFVAKRRYLWFGRHDACISPLGELATRFLK